MEVIFHYKLQEEKHEVIFLPRLNEQTILNGHRYYVYDIIHNLDDKTVKVILWNVKNND